MSLDAAWAVGQGAMFATMGVPAVVTRPEPDDTPIETSLIWVASTTIADPSGAAFQRREAIRTAAVRRSAVATLPRGTRIVAPELQGGVARTWKVEHPDVLEADLIRVVVVPVEAGT
jgi:hypothetical protein